MLCAHQVENQALCHETRLGFDLHRLRPVIGIEVLGIDLGQPLGSKIIESLQELLVDRKVIFHREQAISDAQDIEFARRFANPDVHPFTPKGAACPELVHLDNSPGNPPYISSWPSDVTWRQCPAPGSILRTREIPEVGRGHPLRQY